MKNNVINLIKVICFLAVFGVLFTIVQFVFQYKGRNAFYLQERFDSYQQAVDNGEEIDIVSFGTSSMFRGFSPMIVYEETGATSFNFSGANQDPMCEYYFVKSVLEIQVPKVIILDFSSLFREQEQFDKNFKYVYLRTIDNLPNHQIRQELIDSILAKDSEVNRWELSIPWLRNHTRWTQLEKQDYCLKSNYLEWRKGWLLGFGIENVENTDYVTKAQLASETETIEINQDALYWYEKTLALCKENDIQVLAVSVPNSETGQNASKYKTYEKFCEEKDIPYLNYATQEQVTRLQINDKYDYFDAMHLNLRGAIKLSQVMAQDIDKMFHLEDRRGNSVYSEWDENWDKFYEEQKLFIDLYFYHIES